MSGATLADIMQSQSYNLQTADLTEILTFNSVGLPPALMCTGAFSTAEGAVSQQHLSCYTSSSQSKSLPLTFLAQYKYSSPRWLS